MATIDNGQVLLFEKRMTTADVASVFSCPPNQSMKLSHFSSCFPTCAQCTCAGAPPPKLLILLGLLDHLEPLLLTKEVVASKDEVNFFVLNPARSRLS